MKIEKITVILTCWKRFQHFEEIIKFWLNQEKVKQVIVWDNSGKYKTSPPVLVINSGKNVGPGARLIASQLAEYNTIIFCDDDKKPKNGIIEDFLRYYDENKLVGTSGKIFSGKGYHGKPSIRGYNIEKPIKADYVPYNLCIVHRKHCLLDIKECPNFMLLDDFWWCEELKKKGVSLWIVPTKNYEDYPEGSDENAMHKKVDLGRWRKKYYRKWIEKIDEKILVTGAGGLIGSEVSKFFLDKKAVVIGIDNDMRAEFFGEKGSTKKNIDSLAKNPRFKNYNTDIRKRAEIFSIFRDEGPFDLVVHTAAQPSHDWATKEPRIDFEVNAMGTVNLLEGFRKYSPEGVFIFTSTVKVYGNAPNEAKIKELKKRYDYGKPFMRGISEEGITEEMRIDDSIHSLFGASKTAADIMAQEYAKTYNLKIGIFRPGCLTGSHHSAVEMHGYLVYLIDCAVNKKPYTIFGYGGKQVRDQLHSKDVVGAFYEFYKNPKKGEVYNLGGGRENAISILETIDILEKDYKLKLDYRFRDNPRLGDQKVCILDNSKFKSHYPKWEVEVSLKDIFKEIIKGRAK